MINTTTDLLAMRDADGVIRVEGNLRVKCDVPWSVGRQIQVLDVGGSLSARKSLEVVGYLDVGGKLEVGGGAVRRPEA